MIFLIINFVFKVLFDCSLRKFIEMSFVIFSDFLIMITMTIGCFEFLLLYFKMTILVFMISSPLHIQLPPIDLSIGTVAITTLLL